MENQLDTICSCDNNNNKEQKMDAKTEDMLRKDNKQDKKMMRIRNHQVLPGGRRVQLGCSDVLHEECDRSQKQTNILQPPGSQKCNRCKITLSWTEWTCADYCDLCSSFLMKTSNRAQPLS